MWKRGYHQPVGSDGRGSSDFLFDADYIDYQNDVCNLSANNLNGTTSNDSNTSKGKDRSSSASSSSGKGFFRSLMSHGDSSPKKASAAQRARLDRFEQSQSVYPKSFLDSAIENSKLRSMSPDRASINSQRSNSSLSIQRTPSNTLSKLGLTKLTPKRASDSPFVDSDEDWNDTLDDINDTIDGNGKTSGQFPGRNDVTASLKMENMSLDGLSLMERDAKVDKNYPFLRADYQEIMADPFSILTSQQAPKKDMIKYNKIVKEFLKPTFEVSELKKQTWGGIPASLRALVWPILVGYLSTNKNTRESALTRKRKEYGNSISRLFRGDKDQSIWHQIKIDVLRTNPSIPLYSFEATHRSLEKILYLWAIRHPASGYVQGINDLVTPFFHVFLQHYLAGNVDVDTFDPQCMPKELLNIIEADTYWCFTKVLDTIQNNYIHEQPGIIRQITELKNLIKRDEPSLNAHFEKEHLDFIQFSFRWMNCMLMREFKLNLIIRMWDTYLSDFPTGFSQFHVYVCCAFLRRFSNYLMDMEFQDIIMFLQDTSKNEDWTEDDIEMMLSEAYVWQSLYENASAHLK